MDQDQEVPERLAPASALPSQPPAAKVTRRSRFRMLGSTLVLLGLCTSAAFALNKGCLATPSHGQSFVFAGTLPTSSITLKFSGLRRAGAGNVRVWMGKVTGTQDLTSLKLVPNGTITPNADDSFEKLISIRRDGLAIGAAAGDVIWQNDDVLGFILEENVNGGWSRVSSYNVESAENPWHSVTAIADRAVSTSFPSEASATNCSNADPVPAGKFKCPAPGEKFPSQGAANFLSRKGLGSDGQALLYYGEMPADDRYTSLADFRTKNRFEDTATACRTSSAKEICAWYRNEYDLGFGRQMHCRTVTADPFMGLPTKIACYVTNFRNENDALANRSGADGAIATVAMTWNVNPRASGDAVKDHVRFYVFDAAGNLARKAPLDGGGDKFVPNLCLNCHGGSLNGNRVVGAHFLAFDQALLPLPAGEPDQQDRFTNLNRFVALAERSYQQSGIQTPMQETIFGWYDNFENSDPYFHADFTPPDWLEEKRKTLYLSVVAPYCRSCHLAQPVYPWNTYDNFRAFVSSTKARVCKDRAFSPSTNPLVLTMPHAQRSYQRFWESGAAATLAAEIGPLSTTDTCKFKPLVLDNTF